MDRVRLIISNVINTSLYWYIGKCEKHCYGANQAFVRLPLILVQEDITCEIVDHTYIVHKIWLVQLRLIYSCNGYFSITVLPVHVIRQYT